MAKNKQITVTIEFHEGCLSRNAPIIRDPASIVGDEEGLIEWIRTCQQAGSVEIKTITIEDCDCDDGE